MTALWPELGCWLAGSLSDSGAAFYLSVSVLFCVGLSLLATTTPLDRVYVCDALSSYHWLTINLLRRL